MTTPTISKVLQIGTGAVNRRITDKLRETLSPQDFGAVGDGSTDDTAAIQACFTAAGADGLIVVFVPTLAGYKITDTVTLPVTAGGLNMNGAFLSYAGTKDRPALAIGDSATANQGVQLHALDVRASGTVSWPTDAFIGVKVMNSNHGIIETLRIDGFNIGLDCYSEHYPFAYNRISLGEFADNHIAVKLHTVGTSATAFCNENKFFGGELQCSSASNALGDAFGVVFSWDKSASYRGQNDNIFYGTSFELGSGTIYNRIPVWHDGAGSNNKFLQSRHESNDGVFALIDGGSPSQTLSENLYQPSFDNSVAQNIRAVSQINGAVNNYYESGFLEQRYKETWNSGKVVDLVTAAGANTAYIRGPVHFATSGSGAASRTLNNSNLKTYKDELVVPNGTAIATYIDTHNIKDWIIRVEARTGFGGRLLMQCFDADGAVLTNTGPNQPYVRAGSPITYSTSYGGMWQTGSDGANNFGITFHSDVKTARIMVAGGTNSLLLKSFGLIAMMASQDSTGASAFGSISAYSGLDSDEAVISPVKPDTAGQHGSYPQGRMVLNGAAAVGQPAYWSATTAGIAYLNKVWVASTVYAFTGEIVINGLNAYVCTTAGTSASSGGPTGTGTGIIDGTAVWSYIGLKAIFATSPNLA